MLSFQCWKSMENKFLLNMTSLHSFVLSHSGYLLKTRESPEIFQTVPTQMPLPEHRRPNSEDREPPALDRYFSQTIPALIMGHNWPPGICARNICWPLGFLGDGHGRNWKIYWWQRVLKFPQKEVANPKGQGWPMGWLNSRWKIKIFEVCCHWLTFQE